MPGGAIAVGPSDWEAEGRVAARSIRVQAFRIDAFEVTRGQLAAATGGLGVSGDFARAASGVTLGDAMAYCRGKGGRLPTEDEWIVAAVSASNPPRRYPWGDTGAVCRRAAWGLDTGPCAHGADGPDTVGAHPDGDTATRSPRHGGKRGRVGRRRRPARRARMRPSPREGPGRPPWPPTCASGHAWSCRQARATRGSDSGASTRLDPRFALRSPVP